ncbi:MAG: hypothetical protein KJ025_16590 [Burkholderiales bacterium]|nr:hypothetical protein [Burkholderiales bacterium]
MNFIAPGHESSPDPDFAPEQMRAWLSALPQHDAAAAAAALIERMVAFNRADLQPRARLRTLEMLRDHVEGLVPLLERRLATAAPPLSGPMRQTAYLIEKLFKELAAGYARAVLSVPRSWLNIGYRSQLQTPLVRAMDYHARRLSLAQRLYARSPGAVWAEMHRLFQLARGWRIEEERLESPRRSPLDVYRSSLLLAFAQPSKLTRDEYELLQDYVARHADLAEIAPPAPVADPACVFAIDPLRDRPGVAYAKRHDAKFENGSLLLRTGRLVERLELQLRRLREGVAAASLGLPDEAGSLAYQEMLRRLHSHWRGDRAVRSARAKFHPRVDAWIGLRDIWRALRAELPNDRPREQAAADPPTRATEWIVLNESSRGFALRHMSGAAPPVQVGELVAIKPRDRGSIYVCLVRWVQSNNPEHLEVGLQQLAPVAEPAVYRPSDTERAAPEPILFFPQLPAQRKAAAIAAPPDRLRANDPLSLRHRRGQLNLRAARLIEKTPSVELIEVSAAEPA